MCYCYSVEYDALPDLLGYTAAVCNSFCLSSVCVYDMDVPSLVMDIEVLPKTTDDTVTELTGKTFVICFVVTSVSCTP